MAVVTTINLPEAVHRALRARAAHHGRSTEAEIRDILESAIRPPERVKLGSMLASIALEAKGPAGVEVEQINQIRDKRQPSQCEFLGLEREAKS